MNPGARLANLTRACLKKRILVNDLGSTYLSSNLGPRLRPTQTGERHQILSTEDMHEP